MKEAIGNLWDYPADARVVTTNGFVKKNGAAVMGRGCALEAKTRYPGIEFILGAFLEVGGNHCYLMCYELIRLATSLNLREIVMPRPGCGNGRLQWRHVKPIIEAILDDRFTVITHA